MSETIPNPGSGEAGSPPLIVVTDLDATLLDHESYSFDAAIPALNRLKSLQIPLILNSSKTAKEILNWRQALGIDAPFIVENGAALYVPVNGGFRIELFGMDRADIINMVRMQGQQHGYRFTGFADMNADELAAHTGLDRENAALALDRDYTEPLLWQDSDENFDEFRNNLEAAGLSVVRGGRFIHVAGPVDKGRAISFLRDYYSQRFGRQPLVIALGDSENDVAMLESADYPVLVKSPGHDFLNLKHPRVLRTDASGPVGWNEAMLSLLQTLNRE